MKRMWRHWESWPNFPREAGSAQLALEVMYIRLMVRLNGMSDEEILCMVSLQGMLQEQPLTKAPIMPMLSPLTVTTASWKPVCTIHNAASSRATDSAHPMSLPSALHPSLSFQAAQ